MSDSEYVAIEEFRKITAPQEVVHTAKELSNFQAQQEWEAKEREKEQKHASRQADLAKFEHQDHLPAWLCPWCAAYVSEREKHLDFHYSCNSAAEKADSAYWNDQPIG